MHDYDPPDVESARPRDGWAAVVQVLWVVKAALLGFTIGWYYVNPKWFGF